MRAADYVFKKFAQIGISRAYLVTGRGALFLTDALAKNKEITPICTHHEQSAGYAAAAESQLTGNPSLCLVSTGCASTNTITGVLSAWQDGIPVIFISGQNFLNETVRCVSPVIHMRRTSLVESNIRGQEIGPFEKIALWYGAANRDPEVFKNPDIFDITRKNADKHLAFGIGRHTCLGKPIALMQLNEFFSQFLERFPNYQLNGSWKVAPNNFVHAIQDLPIKLK